MVAITFIVLIWLIIHFARKNGRAVRATARSSVGWQYNPATSDYSDQAFINRSKGYRRQVRAMRSGEAGFYAVANQLMEAPAVKEALDGLPEFRLALRKHTLRVTSEGQTFLASGRMETYASGGPLMRISLRDATPSIFLHELAHFAVDAQAGWYAGHEEAWRDTFYRFMDSAYPGYRGFRA